MHQESWTYEAIAGLREDMAAIRAMVERQDGRFDALEQRMIRLEERQFQTILAVLGTMTAAFGAILASLLG